MVRSASSGRTARRMAILLAVIFLGFGLVCWKPVVGILFLMIVGIGIGLRNIVK